LAELNRFLFSHVCTRKRKAALQTALGTPCNRQVKEVLFDGRCYIVSRNAEEAKKERAACDAILSRL
jgi:hypothetical protein